MRRKYFMRGLGVGIIITALVFTIALVFRGDSSMSDGEIIKRATELGMVPADNTMAGSSSGETESNGSDGSSDADGAEGAGDAEGTNGLDGADGAETNGSEADGAESNDSNGGSVKVETLTGDDVSKAPQETTDPITEKNKNNATSSTTGNKKPTSTGATSGTTSGTSSTGSTGSTGSTTLPGPSRVTESSPGVSNTSSQTSTTEGIISFSVRSGENSAVVAANLYKAGLISNPTQFDSFLEANGYDKNIRPGTYSIRSGSSNETIAKTITRQ